MSLDKYFARPYDRNKYNCLHAACDLWEDETGEDIRYRFGAAFIDGLNTRTAMAARRHGFNMLSQPIDPSLVLMTGALVDPHIGVFVRSKIAHMTPLGFQYVEPFMATRGFDNVRYYK